MLVLMVVCSLLNTACNSAGAQGCWSFQIGVGGSSLEGTPAACRFKSADSVVSTYTYPDAGTCISFVLHQFCPANFPSLISLAKFLIPNIALDGSFVTM
jgi:hypothetical protein